MTIIANLKDPNNDKNNSYLSNKKIP